MLLSLRQAIHQRVQGKSNEELQEIIVESIGSDEKALPGLGVLFEIIWQNCDQGTQEKLVTTLKEHLPEMEAAGTNK